MSYSHPEVLVDTDWVAKNLNSNKVRNLEVDYDPENAYKEVDTSHMQKTFLGRQQ